MSEQQKLPTLADIARRAGVSQGLVSAALSQQQSTIRMTDETRQRILQIAADLHYYPNQLARSLALGTSGMVGIVVPPLVNTISAVMVKEMDRGLREDGFLPFLIELHSPPAEDDPQPLLGYIQELLSHQVAGVIYALNNPMPDSVLSMLQKYNVPTVFFSSLPEGFGRAVFIDRRECARQTIEHLAALGHSEVQMLLSSSDVSHPEKDVNNFCAEGQKQGVRVRHQKDWILHPTPQTLQSTYQLVSDRIHAKDIPTSLICYNDEVAISAIAALKDHGLRVPEDVSVVGKNDEDIASMVRPALTTRTHPYRDKTPEAMLNMLRKQMNDNASDVRYVVLQQDLVIRQSTAPRRRI